MIKRFLLSLLIFFVVQSGFTQQKRKLTLEQVIELAKSNSRSAKQAETSRVLGYWGYRVFKSTLNPQLSLAGTIPAWNRSVTGVTQPDGTVQFRELNQNNSDLRLSFSQNIPWTGGSVSVNTSLNRFDNFDADASLNEIETQYSGVPVNISFTQPLFSVNDFKWNSKIRPLQYEESKREYAQSMESISQTAVTLFFRLLEEQINLQIAQQNVSKNDTIYNIEKGRYNIGTTTEDQLLQTELDLLNARSDAQQAILDVQTRALDLRNFIGLTENVALELVPPSEVSILNVDQGTALRYAKDNRAEYLSFERQRLEARQGIANAKAQRFSADFFASFGYNNQAIDFGDIYQDPNTQSVVRLGFNLPILDGGRNKARMGQAQAQARLTEFNIEQSRINFEQEILTAVRNFDQIRNQIEISKKGEEIAIKRFEITNSRYLIGKIDILTLTNARNAKDAAIRTYIGALRQYWEAYYQLRSLTLYDFQRNLPLYNPLLDYDPGAGR